MMRFAALALGATTVAANLHDRVWYEAEFYNWMNRYGVRIASGEEYVRRLQVFADNNDMIELHNAGNHSYKLGHNKFSHLTLEEFNEMMGLNNPRPPKPVASSIHRATGLEATPATVDWVAKGAVTGVKDQGQCGSCWSFSTTGSLEGAYAIKYGNLVSFSEQQLVDCDKTDYGCNGGLMDTAFKWIEGNGGLCTEQAYPYTSGTTEKRGTCQTSCTLVSGSKISTYTDVQSDNEDALQTAVAQQPVSVAIQANQLGFQFYRSGVFTGNCGTNLDHGVLAVGYGVWTDGTPYWQVKNSWGTSWGMDGYILLEKGKDQTGGQCGIAVEPSYPSV